MAEETRSQKAAASAHERQQEDDAHNGERGADGTVAQELRQAVREAALEVFGPAARQATSSAAKYAVRKGPELVTKNVMPTVLKAGGASGLAQQAMSKGGEALSGAGGIGSLAVKLLSKLGGKGRGDPATGWGKGRRMPIQQHIYVSVPVRQAYDGWTEYKQWPRYMHRANQVDAQVNEKEARVKVTGKMWGFKRPFTAEVVAQRPDQYIKWNATEGVKHTGVINFHELGPRLTLIEVNLDHSPSGPVEKLARGARFVKRAVRADFHRFQGWIEMKSDDELEELEGWRGTIEGGRIVKSHEDALEEEQPEQQGEQQEPVGEYEEEPVAGVEEEPDGEYEEEPEAAEQDRPEADAGGDDEAADGRRLGPRQPRQRTRQAHRAEEERRGTPTRGRQPRPADPPRARPAPGSPRRHRS